MILTIGMIVKNEEKHLRSCLEAISPILNQVDSELIIADTGSTDSTVEIAGSFTNKVLNFEWCNDFSAARNSTLERAKGEWYMWLDADEIFENVDEIIAFFNSGEYKKYNSASYIIRNSNYENNTQCIDFNAFRIAKIRKDTHFENRIHETIPLYEPFINLSSIANHYGYLTENNDEFIKKKSQRNLDLLFLELEQDPCNCKYFLEIGQAYSLAKNYKSALEYFTKGLRYAKKQNHFLLYPFYGDTAHAMFGLGKFSDILSITEEYFKNKKSKSEIDLQMYYLEATSYYGLKNYKEAIDSYKQYIEFYKEYHKGFYRTKDSFQFLVQFTDSFYLRTACMNLIYACMEEKDYDSAEAFFKLIPVTDWNEDERDIDRRLMLEMNFMEATGNYSPLIELLQQLNEHHLVLLQTMIEPKLEDESKRNLLLTKIINSDLEQTDYIKLLKLRYSFFCDHSLTKQKVKTFITEIQDWNPLFADAVYLALKFEVDVDFLASNINAYDLGNLISSNFLHFKDMPQMICNTLDILHENKNINSQLWLSFLLIWALSSDQLTPKQTIQLFYAYAETTKAFMSAVYKQEILAEENMHLFPKHLKVGYYCNLALDYWKHGEKSKYIEYLKIVLKICPEFKHAIKVLLDELQKDLDNESKKSDLSEFEIYAAMVKKNINQLINAGNYNQAAELLNSYEELCPSDKEIEALKNRLETSS